MSEIRHESAEYPDPFQPKAKSRICKDCGKSFEPKQWQIAGRHHECLACKRLRQNAFNAKRDLAAYGRQHYAQPHVKASIVAYHKRKRLDPSYLARRRARRLVAYAIECGKLFRKPCERCGAEKVDAHHRDYNEALDVQWFCRRCHFAVERELADALLKARALPGREQLP